MLTGLCGLYLQSNLLVSLLHIYILSETENLHPISLFSTSLVAQRVKRLPTMWETQVRSLGGEDLLAKEMATHSSILT